MNLAEKIIAYKTLTQEIATLEEQKKSLGQEIIAEMTDKKMEIGGYSAYRYNRLAISVPLEQARLFGATKIAEQVDKEKIKELYNMGQQIEGVKEFSYLVVTTKKDKISAADEP